MPYFGFTGYFGFPLSSHASGLDSLVSKAFCCFLERLFGFGSPEIPKPTKASQNQMPRKQRLQFRNMQKQSPLVVKIELLSFGASLVLLGPGLRPSLLRITRVSVHVYLPGGPSVICLKLLSSDASLVIVRAGVWPALF